LSFVHDDGVRLRRGNTNADSDGNRDIDSYSYSYSYSYAYTDFNSNTYGNSKACPDSKTHPHTETAPYTTALRIKTRNTRVVKLALAQLANWQSLLQSIASVRCRLQGRWHRARIKTVHFKVWHFSFAQNRTAINSN
jgi:hypothetical protein